MKTVIHIIAAAFILSSASCAVYVGPSVPNSNGVKSEVKNPILSTDTIVVTNFSPTYHLLNRSYHLHNGGIFVTRLAMVLR